MQCLFFFRTSVSPSNGYSMEQTEGHPLAATSQAYLSQEGPKGRVSEDPQGCWRGGKALFLITRVKPGVIHPAVGSGGR